MRTYKVQTTCGGILVGINCRKGKYSFNIKVEKFGDCSAYYFISHAIQGMLNSGRNPREVIGELRQYKCKRGSIGCLEQAANCLEDFLEKRA